MKKIILGLFIFLTIGLGNLVHAQTNYLIIDPNGNGNGTLPNTGLTNLFGIKFGTNGSGEGIASSRPLNGTTNVNGLNFLTNFTTRFNIYNSGNVGFMDGGTYEYVSFVAGNRAIGINNTSPTAILHVVGNPANTATNSNLVTFQTGGSTTDYKKMVFGLTSSGNGNIMSIDGRYVSAGVENAGPLLLQNGTGNLGVGSFPAAPNQISSPQSKLHVQYGAIQVSQSSAPVSPTTNKTGLTMGSVGTTSAVATTDYSWLQSSSGPLVLNPLSGNDMTTTSNTYRYVAIGYTPSGTLSTGMAGYNLLVGGKVMCEELKIKLKTAANWPDYVFAPGYKLMSVDSLQSYINTNCHLPEIPSAKDVAENGIMTGEMNGLLLKKVEELTLYMLEQNKKTDEQSKLMGQQQEEIKLLKEQNELLMQQVKALMQK